MNSIDRKQYLAIQTSLNVLISLCDEIRNHGHRFASTQAAWNARHTRFPSNILAGPNLMAFGWAVVVRFFELTKETQKVNGRDKPTLPVDLRNALAKAAARNDCLLDSQGVVERTYGCTIKKIELTAPEDGGLFICSFVRHLRNAFSHFDCTFDDDKTLIQLCHNYKGDTRLDMTIQVVQFLELISKIGVSFCLAIEELNVLSD